MGRETNRNTIFAALLVVVATGASIYLLNRDGPETKPDRAPVEQEVLEIQPAVPAVVDASWHDRRRRRPEPAEPAEPMSLLEAVEWGDEAERRDRLEKSLERTMDEIKGLGVYIATDEEEDAGKR